MLTGLCCMRLRTAGVVIGWLCTAGAVIGLIGSGVVLSQREVIADLIVEKEISEDTSKEEMKKSILSILTLMTSVYMAAALINLIASAFLIAGTIMERHLMILPWLINSGMWFIVSCLYYIIAVFSLQFAIILPTSISLGLHAWIWCAIYSLFKTIQFKRNEERSDPNKVRDYRQFRDAEKPPMSY